MSTAYFESLYGEAKDTTHDNQLIFTCPSCQKVKLYVYLDSRTSYCFRCGEWKSYGDKGVTYSLDTLKESLYKRPKLAEEVKEVKIPDNFVSIDQNGDMEYYINYLKGRGFTKYDIDRNKLLFGKRGTRNRKTILLPVYMGGSLVYYTKRVLDPKPGFYVNPSSEEVDTKKVNILFNYDYARACSTVVVCEGIFDAMTVGVNAIATLGKLVSKEQLSLITKNWNTIILALDPDAYEQTDKFYTYFKSRGKDVKIYDLRGYKDINEAGREKVVDDLFELESKNFSFTDLYSFNLVNNLKRMMR